MQCSPYLRRPLRSYAEALADHQPDIVYQGDNTRRGRDRAANAAAHMTRAIAFEIGRIVRSPDPRIKARARVWIIDAQRARREAFKARKCYDAVLQCR